MRCIFEHPPVINVTDVAQPGGRQTSRFMGSGGKGAPQETVRRASHAASWSLPEVQGPEHKPELPDSRHLSDPLLSAAILANQAQLSARIVPACLPVWRIF
jgi:hypothetical protein